MRAGRKGAPECWKGRCGRAASRRRRPPPLRFHSLPANAVGAARDDYCLRGDVPGFQEGFWHTSHRRWHLVDDGGGERLAGLRDLPTTPCELQGAITRSNARPRIALLAIPGKKVELVHVNCCRRSFPRSRLHNMAAVCGVAAAVVADRMAAPLASTSSRVLAPVRCSVQRQQRRHRRALHVAAVASPVKPAAGKAGKAGVPISPEDAAALYSDMVLGREFEEMCAQMYYRGKMFGFVHLYSGQEAVSTGAPPPPPAWQPGSPLPPAALPAS